MFFSFFLFVFSGVCFVLLFVVLVVVLFVFCCFVFVSFLRFVISSGYERGLTGFCGFVKIRVFVGISVFTRVLVYRTFVHFQGVFGEDFTQFLPNGYSTFVLTKLALEEIFLLRKILILGGFRL